MGMGLKLTLSLAGLFEITVFNRVYSRKVHTFSFLNIV